MSTCESSLRHIFESTITETSSTSASLIDTLSSPWKQIRPIKPPHEHSFTEIFGELHFKERPDPVYASASPWQPPSKVSPGYSSTEDAKKNEYCHKRSESLQLCTEGLGSESLDYAEDLKVECPGTWLDYNKSDSEKSKMREKMNARVNSGDRYRKRRTNGMTFPPPISCIGKTGKPGVWFQSSRQDGRFILEEIKIPTYERFHASREDGRLRLCFIQQSDEDEDGDDDGNDATETVDKDDSSAVENEGEEQRKDETFVKDDIGRSGHS